MRTALVQPSVGCAMRIACCDRQAGASPNKCLHTACVPPACFVTIKNNVPHIIVHGGSKGKQASKPLRANLADGAAATTFVSCRDNLRGPHEGETRQDYLYTHISVVLKGTGKCRSFQCRSNTPGLEKAAVEELACCAADLWEGTVEKTASVFPKATCLCCGTC